MTSLLRKLPLTAAAALGLTATLSAQTDTDEPLVMTVGTTHSDTPSGATWGYLTWQETADGALGSDPIAVFRKEGAPDDAVPYERVAVTTWFTDPLTVESLLNRAPELNDDLELLESHVDQLFGEMLEETADLGDGDTVSLSRKVAALLDTARNDAEMRDTVVWLARVHPVLQLCLGRAHAEVIRDDGPTTFEVRRWDAAAGESTEVIGRVSLDPTDSQNRMLPAPYAPVEIDEGSAQGHLAVRLAWGTPEDLLLRSPLHFGYNIYRMDEAYAQGVGYHEDPPATRDLIAYADDATFQEVTRVNQAPVLAKEILTQQEAANLSAPDGAPSAQEPLFFFSDDNDRFHDGESFEDGDTFYYFLTARDILGRDGHVSDGTFVMVCDRMPPNPPSRVSVDNRYAYDEGSGEDAHHLEVTWDLESGDEADRYYVYRFTSVQQMQEATAADYRTEGHQIAGPIPAEEAENGGRFLRYIDDGSGNGAASGDYPAAEDYGVPYFYTVRAENEAACDGNLSGHSPPAWGVLRQREGPGAATAEIRPLSRIIHATAPDSVDNLDLGVELSEHLVYQAAALRHHPAIEWVEFRVVGPIRAPYAPRSLGRFDFGDEDEVSANFTFWIGNLPQPPDITAIFGGSGLVPASATVNLMELDGIGDTGQNGNVGRMLFEADIETGPGLDGADPNVHVSTDPETGEILCLDVVVNLDGSDRAAEWRIYRRLAGGPMELVHQEMRDPSDAGTLAWQDCSLPARGGVACYFVQALDDEGNPGPITRAGCTEIQPTQDLPRPMLFPVEAGGTDENPTTRISWFSSPEGVERFEVLIAADPGTPPENVGGELGQRRGAFPVLPFPPFDKRFFVYETGRTDTVFQGDGPEWEVEIDLPPGVDYTVRVRAVGPGPYDGVAEDTNNELPAIAERSRGPLSNAEDYRWRLPEEEPGPLVPWPALDPPYVASADPRITAMLISAETGAGVRIGEFHFLYEDEPAPMPDHFPFPYPAEQDPNDRVYTIEGEQSDPDDPTTEKSILPAALYRYQVPSPMFPEVHGNLVQVSPLVEEIAYWDGWIGERPSDFGRIEDPFIAAREKEGWEGDSIYTHDLFLVDNQPVMFGARYRYLLVRFTDDGEIDRVFPVPELDLSPNSGNGD